MNFSLNERIQQGKIDFQGNGCWIWNGNKNPKGYGLIKLQKRQRLVHRLVLAEALGREIKEGLFACHRCHNPSCVNPGHLYEGTNFQNVMDMINADRAPKSKLSISLVRQIKDLVAERNDFSNIAREFNVDRSTVSRIASGKIWKDV